MKKLLIIALAAIPVLFACKKGSSTEEVSLDTPKNAKNAAKVVINNPIQVSTKSNKTVAIKLIDFLRSGRYVAEGVISKAEEETVILTGPYSVGTDGKYNCTGDITVTVETSATSVTIDGQTSDATVTHSRVEEGSNEDHAFRSWTLQNDNSAIILEFQSLGGKAKYANISSIAKDLENHEISISDELKTKLINHDIKLVSLDEGVISVEFTNADPFKGVFTLKKDMSFDYDLSDFMSGDLFQAKAKGSVTIEGQKAIVKINVESGIQKLGNGTAIITMVAVKD